MWLVVAVLTSAHGLKGEMKVDVRTDSPDERLYPGAVLETDPAAAGPLTIVKTRRYKGSLYLCFDEVRDRTTAESLRNVALVIESDEVDDEEENAWYPHELRGLEALDPEGYELGVVKDLRLLPAQDVLVVQDHEGRLIDVPFVEEIVPEVDVADHCVVIDPPEGLFPHESEYTPENVDANNADNDDCVR